MEGWRDFGAQKDRKSPKSVPHGTVEGARLRGLTYPFAVKIASGGLREN